MQNQLSCVTGENHFCITFKGEKVIEHSLEKPCISIGVGNASFKMKRGAFKIKDKLIRKIALTNFKISKSDNYKQVTVFSRDNKLSLTFKLLIKEGRLQLLFNEESRQQLTDSGFNRLWLNLAATEEERIYGCGEHYSRYNLRGERVRIWVAEHQNLNRILLKTIRRKLHWQKEMPFEKYESYYVQPTFLSSSKYFVHADSEAFMEFDFRKPSSHQLLFHEIPERIIIDRQKSFEKLLESLSSLLGKQPPLPDWVHEGVILGLQGGRKVVEEKVEKSLKSGLPIVGIWCQDWVGRRKTSFGMQLMWDWRFDETLYPDYKEFIDNLAVRGIRFLGYINPFLAIEGELYREASKKGYTVKNQKGEDYLVTITTFPAAMVDLTNPQAYVWIKEVIKDRMIGAGLSGWMADFGEYLPTDAVLFSGEDAAKVHNRWPALWARVNREAIEETDKLGEIFFFTRAGFTGTVKYSTLMWTGDHHVDWSRDDGLPSTIPAMLSMACSGFGLSHTDIGGYTTLFDMKRSKELFMRWAELGAFTPLMRNHEGNRPSDNVQFDYDAEVLEHFARMGKIHKRLAPYLKKVVSETAQRGLPAVRPLFFNYDNDDYTFMINDEYLLGPDLLVAPVLAEGQKNRKVYLPDDKWIHFWTKSEYKKGTFLIKAPLGYPPVFYRKSSSFSNLFKSLR